MRSILLTSAALLVVTACTSERVVDASEWETSAPPSETVADPGPPSLPPTNPANLANTSEFAQDSDGQPAYYFSTPSGRWQCAILPKQKAGCEATGSALSITDAPDTVPNAAGVATPPNAILVGPQGDAHFAALDVAQFAPPSPANVLPFAKTLDVGAFRCNIQETTGVSCLSETSGKGFTFSADGYQLQYTEVPLEAP